MSFVTAVSNLNKIGSNQLVKNVARGLGAGTGIAGLGLFVDQKVKSDRAEPENRLVSARIEQTLALQQKIDSDNQLLLANLESQIAKRQSETSGKLKILADKLEEGIQVTEAKVSEVTSVHQDNPTPTVDHQIADIVVEEPLRVQSTRNTGRLEKLNNMVNDMSPVQKMSAALSIAAAALALVEAVCRMRRKPKIEELSERFFIVRRLMKQCTDSSGAVAAENEHVYRALEAELAKLDLKIKSVS